MRGNGDVHNIIRKYFSREFSVSFSSRGNTPVDCNNTNNCNNSCSGTNKTYSATWSQLVCFYRSNPRNSIRILRANKTDLIAFHENFFFLY